MARRRHGRRGPGSRPLADPSAARIRSSMPGAGRVLPVAPALLCQQEHKGTAFVSHYYIMLFLWCVMAEPRTAPPVCRYYYYVAVGSRASSTGRHPLQQPHVLYTYGIPRLDEVSVYDHEPTYSEVNTQQLRGCTSFYAWHVRMPTGAYVICVCADRASFCQLQLQTSIAL